MAGVKWDTLVNSLGKPFSRESYKCRLALVSISPYFSFALHSYEIRRKWAIILGSTFSDVFHFSANVSEYNPPVFNQIMSNQSLSWSDIYQTKSKKIIIFTINSLYSGD